MAIFRFHLKDEADPVTLSVSGKGQILDRFLILLNASFIYELFGGAICNLFYLQIIWFCNVQHQIICSINSFAFK